MNRDDELDGCAALELLPLSRRVHDGEVVRLVLSAGVEDRTDLDTIARRLAEYRELFGAL